jgi:cell division protein FtsW (lipid II flippase)
MFKIFTGRLILLRMIMLSAMLTLIVIGLLTIYAVGNPTGTEPNDFENSWKRQAVYAAAGLIAIVMINLVNYRRFGAISYGLYTAVLALLAILLLDKIIDIPFVPVINYTRRWIRIGSVQMQPSEFCKIAYILALAWYLRYRRNYRKLKGLIVPFALTLLAMVLIIFEPDLGTVALMMPILFAMLFVAGAKVKHFLIIFLMALLISPLLWGFMEDYQKSRITSFLLQNEWIMEKAKQNPKLATILAGSPQGLANWKRAEGYHLTHSKYAIASGGWIGYGFAKGPYIKYDYLPERHNDFIFAAIAHQAGFFGALFVLLIYAVIIACGLEIAWNNTDPFARLTAVGIVTMFAIQVIINVSMTLGLMPVTGLTLPFLSHGGSSLIVSMLAIGILNNIGRSRPFSVAKKDFEFPTPPKTRITREKTFPPR